MGYAEKVNGYQTTGFETGNNSSQTADIMVDTDTAPTESSESGDEPFAAEWAEIMAAAAKSCHLKDKRERWGYGEPSVPYEEYIDAGGWDRPEYNVVRGNRSFGVMPCHTGHTKRFPSKRGRSYLITILLMLLACFVLVTDGMNILPDPMWDLEVFSAASVTEVPKGSLSAQAEYINNEQRKEDSRALHLFRRGVISGETHKVFSSGLTEIRYEKGINAFDATWESGEWDLQPDKVTDMLQANSAIAMHLPDGVYVTPVNERFEVDGTTEIQYCRHQRGSVETLAGFKEVCNRNINKFAYTLKGMPGYNRPAGEGPGWLKIKYTAEKPAFAPRRRQSALEIMITNEKCNELLEAGLIEPAPESVYASAPVIAAKKAPDGT